MHAAYRPPRVFVSYSRDDPNHRADVHRLCQLLQTNRVDVRLDDYYHGPRHDWQAWMTREITDADYVIVASSSAYRAAGDGNGDAGRNLGVQAEAALLREMLYADRANWTRKVLPVVLPGNSVDDIPLFLQPRTATHYIITELTDAGIGELQRTINGWPPGWTPPPQRPTPRPRRRLRAGQVILLVVVGFMVDGIVQAATYHAPSFPQPPTVTTTTTSPTPGPAFAAPTTPDRPTGPPADCQQLEAAITTWQQTVGPTWYSRETTATRAGTAIEAAYPSAVSSTLSPDFYALINDFTFLQQKAIEGDSSGYDAVLAQTKVDIQTLRTDCAD